MGFSLPPNSAFRKKEGGKTFRKGLIAFVVRERPRERAGARTELADAKHAAARALGGGADDDDPDADAAAANAAAAAEAANDAQPWTALELNEPADVSGVVVQQVTAERRNPPREGANSL